jgi:hypothetical protein
MSGKITSGADSHSLYDREGNYIAAIDSYTEALEFSEDLNIS